MSLPADNSKFRIADGPDGKLGRLRQTVADDNPRRQNGKASRLKVHLPTHENGPLLVRFF
jgi:hypothetical protein